MIQPERFTRAFTAYLKGHFHRNKVDFQSAGTMRVSIFAPLLTATLFAVAHVAFGATIDSDKLSSQYSNNINDVRTVIVRNPNTRVALRRNTGTFQPEDKRWFIDYLLQAANYLHDFIFLQPIPNTGEFNLIYDSYCGNADVLSCVYNGVGYVLSVFFEVFFNYMKRDGDIFVTDFPALPGCNTRCRLRTEAEEGPFRPIGNFTRIVNGTSEVHTIHYMRIGALQGLRSQGPSTTNVTGSPLERRGDVDDYGGVVATYNWYEGNEANYDSFDSYSDQIAGAATDVVNVFEESNVLVSCVSFMTQPEDNSGASNTFSYLNTGAFSIGWNDQAYVYDDNELTDILEECSEYESGELNWYVFPCIRIEALYC